MTIEGKALPGNPHRVVVYSDKQVYLGQRLNVSVEGETYPFRVIEVQNNFFICESV